VTEEQLQAYQALLKKRKRQEGLSREEKQVSDQFSSVVAAGGLEFNTLPVDQHVGVVVNTIWVKKVPGRIRAYEKTLKSYDLVGRYMIGFLWLLYQPVFALRVEDVPLWEEAARGPGFNQDLEAFLKALGGRAPGALEAVLKGDQTLGSSHALVLREVLYVPLWPSKLIRTEGHLGEWGSAVLKREGL
jgi:hypothetical protein